MMGTLGDERKKMRGIGEGKGGGGGDEKDD